ncbi:MAG TPA: peptidoglycan DD-metalloendopeptidase family protein [Anaerolineales bacterium]|nr:peptidoglycan DD-metalloendopeptidase family protein [Anaerolineales bacterium]
MKRLISLFIAASFLLSASACGGSPSLWGQYATPTPLGGASPTSPPPPTLVPTQTAEPTRPLAMEPEKTPTPTFNEAFVTQEATLSAKEASQTAENTPTLLYYAQSGDWLPAIAIRFGVDVNQIASPKILPEKGLLDPGTLLIIPDTLDRSIPFTPAVQLIPDNELIFSSTAIDFDVSTYVAEAGGYLSSHREYLLSTGWMSGAREIERLAYENSINPRLLLGILDYEAHWVRGTPDSDFRVDYPLGHESFKYKGMFMQMVWAINKLSTGYYEWRAGRMTELTFRDGNKLRIDPTLNAGTVALMYYFSRNHSYNEWLRIMDQTSGFLSFYQNMFGDPWSRADVFGPIFPPGISQPEMSLPFEIEAAWAFTGGPHAAWENEGPFSALDFAPPSAKTGCLPSDHWIVSAAPGLVVRSGNGVVVVDTDGDGSEQTGWNLLYLHVESNGRVAKGVWVEQDDHIGHPSCEGGTSTGTHLHFARKYNGEWVIADGPLPFVLSGWTVYAGEKPYQGKLVKGDKVITADLYAQSLAVILRETDDE